MKRESEVAQSCPTLSTPMDCSPPGSSIHGVFQATVLEWGAIAFSVSPTKALQIAVKRKEVKSKGEKARYKHLNSEFQRLSRRDKKAFLSDQCKEIEENNRMGKTRDLFKKRRSRKSRDTKGIFHAKMGSIKERNGMDLTEAEDIKKRWHPACLL